MSCIHRCLPSFLYRSNSRNDPSFHETKTWAVSQQSWVIGGLFITRQKLRLPGACWSDGEGGYYFACPADPRMTHTNADLPFTAICCFGSDGARFQIGEAIVDVFKPKDDNYTYDGIVEQLEFLEKQTFSFKTPEVLFHGLLGGYQHLIYTLSHGQRVGDVWPRLQNDTAKQRQLAEAVAGVYQQLAACPGSPILCDLLGNGLYEPMLREGGDPIRHVMDDDDARRRFAEIKVQDLTPVLTDNYMKPADIYVDAHLKVTCIAALSQPAYVPKAWIRTKLGLAPSIQLNTGWTDKEIEGWRSALDQALADLGFETREKEYVAAHAWWDSE